MLLNFTRNIELLPRHCFEHLRQLKRAAPQMVAHGHHDPKRTRIIYKKTIFSIIEGMTSRVIFKKIFVIPFHTALARVCRGRNS